MIHVHDLTYSYPNAEIPSLRNIEFNVEPGECIGIIGENGAGKSTLCSALMGLVPHFYHGTIRGDLWLGGVNVPDSSMAQMAQRAGLVFQNPAHQFSGTKLTVQEEIAFGMENLGVDRETMLERIAWVTARLGIEHLIYRNPYELSGGQMQRVAIASILVLKTKVLILDEPTSQLDPFGTAEVFSTIQSLRKEGITIVMVEHKTELLSQHCSRLGVMVKGELKIIDTPDVVFSHPDIEQWGVDVPRFIQAYRAIDADTKTTPTTLEQTIERLNQYELSYRR